MQESGDTFTGVGGVPLVWRCWRPDRAPKAVVVIVHGIGDHSGRYGEAASLLAGDGMAVYTYDQRGHGVSPGQRGHIDSWSDYLDDLSLFLDCVRGWEAGLPVFLWGHSMGALVAIDFALGCGAAIAGVIASGAPFEPAGVKSRGKVLAARLLSRFWPRFPIRLGIDPASLIVDEDRRAAYVADDLIHRRVSARWGTEILAAIDRVNRAAAEFRLPLLLQHGGRDVINSPAGSERFHRHAGSAAKELRVYPQAGHDPHRDTTADEVVRDIVSWIERRLAASPAAPA